MDKISELKKLANTLRREILEISYSTGKKGVHIGPALSVADILAALYGAIMKYDVNNPQWDERDRFVLSKGHAYAALYSILSLKGFFSHEELISNFMTDGGLYPAHPLKNLEKGIECSSGSLGMGLSFAIGKAIAAKMGNKDYRTFVIVGDGECNEGNIWEAFMFAAQKKLDNLTVFIDHNKFQQDGYTKDNLHIPFASMLAPLGWCVKEIDGHDIAAICDATNTTHTGQPLVVVCNTIKGKGVSFMENNNSWHHAAMTEEQYNEALKELDAQ